jgi:8-oxo-dGTP pyrophosphatase MutT (NUDIX family)
VQLRRSSARVLPVNREGRVLLQLVRGLQPRSARRWLTIGGGLKPGETLAEAAAREMREEAGIVVDPTALGQPIGTSVIRYTAFGVLPVTDYLTYFAIALDEAEPSFAHQSRLERHVIEAHEWLTADELDGRTERLADDALPRLIRVAVAAVRPLRQVARHIQRLPLVELSSC